MRTRAFQTAIIAPLLASLLFHPVLCAEELAWVRILSAGGGRVDWRPGEPWPKKTEGFPFSPSLVLSYTALVPGSSLSREDLEKSAKDWERSLEESGRFSRAAVYVVEARGEGALGAIAEVEVLGWPLFGGGADYGEATFLTLGGRRASLDLVAGANEAAVAYRDYALGDKAYVLEAAASYNNDLASSGRLDGNRLSASLGLGPRLGPLGSLVLGLRGRMPLQSGVGALVAVDCAIDLRTVDFCEVEALDASLGSVWSSYPLTKAQRVFASSRLRLCHGPGTITLRLGGGVCVGNIDERELFELGSGEIALRGPEAHEATADRYFLAGLDVDIALVRARPAPWLELGIGPFAYAELADARISGGARILDSAGAGLRARLGPPLDLSLDLGYGFGNDGGRGPVLALSSHEAF